MMTMREMDGVAALAARGASVAEVATERGRLHDVTLDVIVNRLPVDFAVREWCGDVWREVYGVECTGLCDECQLGTYTRAGVWIHEEADE